MAGKEASASYGQNAIGSRKIRRPNFHPDPFAEYSPGSEERSRLISLATGRISRYI
jgi:hypothetical protein